METTFLDFNRLKCKDHPFDLTNNFCINENCMIGLCAQCICSHTQMHMNEKSKPSYKPVKQIHSIIHQQLNTSIKLLESDKDRIMNVMKKILDRKKQYQNILQEAKKDILMIVDKIFQEAETRFENEVKQEEKKTGMHSIYQMQLLCKKINRQISNLINEAHQLNSNKFLDMIKCIRQSTLNEVVSLRRQIGQQIKQNQEFTPVLLYRKQLLTGIQLSIKSLFSNSFSYPKVKCAPKENPITEMRQTQRGSREKYQSTRPAITILPVNLQNVSPQISMRNSLISDQNRPVQTIKHDRSASNFMVRSNSSSGLSFVPQYLDISNMPYNINKKMASTAGSSEFKLSGSRIFQVGFKELTNQAVYR